MEKNYLGFGLDRISDLPGNVIDSILAFLPLKDAVRTCALSVKWREKWHTLPQIIVEENQFSEKQKQEIEGVIHYILNRHIGKVYKFYLSVGRVKGCYHMKSWLWSLSQKGIQDLSLKIRKHRHNVVPSDLFSCLQLRKLKLRHFEFKSPLAFRGFHQLVSLELKEIDIDTQTFESLVASCSQLEQLVIKDVSCVDHLYINAVNLKYFSFDGEFKSIRFNCPRLVVMSLDLYQTGSGNTQFDLRFIIRGLPPSLEELYVRCPFKKFLSAGNRLTEDSTTYSHLKILELDEFCFKQADELSCLLSLVGSFPNLQNLNVASCDCTKGDGTTSGPESKFWEEERNFDSLNQLQSMKMTAFHGEDAELKFIEFILANSAILGDVTIEYASDDGFVEKLVLARLMRFPRLSVKAEVKYVAQSSDSNSVGDDSSDYDGDNASDDSYSTDSD